MTLDEYLEQVEGIGYSNRKTQLGKELNQIILNFKTSKMATLNMVATTPSQPKQLTDLDNILSQLSSHNSNLVTTISNLEKIGHKLKNTDNTLSDQSSKIAEDQPIEPDGTLRQIFDQLGYYEKHVGRLVDYLNKLEALI